MTSYKLAQNCSIIIITVTVDNLQDLSKKLAFLLQIVKRECPRPCDMTKMWHMLEKFISFIFCPEIPHDELINVVYFFCSDLLLFSRKLAKTVQDANH